MDLRIGVRLPLHFQAVLESSAAKGNNQILKYVTDGTITLILTSRKTSGQRRKIC
jgi:hypothetical protein